MFGKAPPALLILCDKIRMGTLEDDCPCDVDQRRRCERGAGIFVGTFSASSSVHSSQSQRRRKGQTGVGGGGGIHHLSDTVKSERRGDKLKIGS